MVRLALQLVIGLITFALGYQFCRLLNPTADDLRTIWIRDARLSSSNFIRSPTDHYRCPNFIPASDDRRYAGIRHQVLFDIDWLVERRREAAFIAFFSDQQPLTKSRISLLGLTDSDKLRFEQLRLEYESGLIWSKRLKYFIYNCAN
jgi:hypothetical protein